jgi:hypothetical protein
LQVRRRACEPALARVPVSHDRGERLIHFVGDARHQLTHRRHARNVRELALRDLQCLLRMLPFDDFFAQFFIGICKLDGAFPHPRTQFIVRTL